MHHTGNWFLSDGVARVGRVALAFLDREPVLDLVPLGMVEAHAEHGGVGELVHALVEPEEDRVEVERGGDLLADVAQQLDVRRALALRTRQRLGRLGAELRLARDATVPAPRPIRRRRWMRSTAKMPAASKAR